MPKIIVKFQHYRNDGSNQLEINPNDPSDVCAKVQELVGIPLLSVRVIDAPMPNQDWRSNVSNRIRLVG
jgi:hypothetical protein